MNKLLYIPAVIIACIMMMCGLVFTALVSVVACVMYVFGRVFLCPFGKHLTGWEFKSSRFHKGVEEVYRHDVHCAFCDHIDKKVS